MVGPLSLILTPFQNPNIREPTPVIPDSDWPPAPDLPLTRTSHPDPDLLNTHHPSHHDV